MENRIQNSDSEAGGAAGDSEASEAGEAAGVENQNLRETEGSDANKIEAGPK